MSARACSGVASRPPFVGNDTVEEFWRWEGLSSNPQINSLNATPSVVQLTDDNGDGVINEYDIPDLPRRGSAHSSAPAQTALVALDGRTGQELWSRTDIRLSQFSSPATGDIDNDGVAEVIAARLSRGTDRFRERRNAEMAPPPTAPACRFH